jgi:methylmalonyl-CoA/ethylmalonyl-CoA epimerase
MIGNLNHVAIAVPDIESSSKIYKNILGAQVSEPLEQKEHGVNIVFIELPNTKIELITPLSDDSPINKFLEKNPNGGIHHICYEVANIYSARDKLIEKGAKIIGDGTPKVGAHGKLIIFLNPKDFNGTLIELEEI